MLTRRQWLALLPLIAVSTVRTRAQAGRRLQVFKDATCGCCAVWVEHMRKQGFTATATDVADMAAIKTKYKVSEKVRSCHTAFVDGYVIEGHVPAADVARLLKERPDVVGIGVPGMPIGSPGMEVAGVKPHPYDVLSFDAEGRTRVFASHNK
jgi:hypothetical protein